MPDADLSGAVLDGRYQVIEPIAEGAMGAVYRGERVKLGRAVAIKIMHDALPDELSSRQRFEREAKLMALLEHPHCVSVIDFGLHDDKPYLVMELVRGTSLLELLAKVGRLEPVRAADIMRQVLSGLQHAHELGVIHRDIKPANIMLTEKTGLGEQVRILDFGLARPAIETTKLTTGIVVGTPNYMAPEQIKGGAIDARTDLYGCGVMLFELLTGTKPFRADDPLAVVRKHLHDPPPRLADVVPDVDFGDLESVVSRALSKLPRDRFASAAEMSSAIDQASPRPAVMAHAIPRRISSQASAPQELATVTGWEVPAAAPESPPTAPPKVEPGSVPPTRVFNARLRITPRQILMGSGGLGILLIIIVAARHSSSATPAPAFGPAHPIAAHVADATPSTDPVAPALARGADLYSNGDLEPALDVVMKARRHHPDSAPLAFLAGKIYFAKLWWSDGITALDDAMRLDAGYRNNPELIKLALRGFLTTPQTNPGLAGLLTEIGAPARPFLDETAKSHPNAMLRARASAELKQLP